MMGYISVISALGVVVRRSTSTTQQVQDQLEQSLDLVSKTPNLTKPNQSNQDKQRKQTPQKTIIFLSLELILIP